MRTRWLMVIGLGLAIGAGQTIGMGILYARSLSHDQCEEPVDIAAVARAMGL
jgi:hypothetical protein